MRGFGDVHEEDDDDEDDEAKRNEGEVERKAGGRGEGGKEKEEATRYKEEEDLPFLSRQNFEEDQERKVALARNKLVNHLVKNLPHEVDKSRIWSYVLEHSRLLFAACFQLLQLLWNVTTVRNFNPAILTIQHMS